MSATVYRMTYSSVFTPGILSNHQYTVVVVVFPHESGVVSAESVVPATVLTADQRSP